MIDSTLQEIFLKNLADEKQTGITFINGNDKTEYLSYKKLFLEATYMLYDLQQKGLKPGDEVIFQFQSIRNFIVTFWACVFGKMIPVPITFGVYEDVMSKIGNIWKKLENPYVISDLDSSKTIFSNFYQKTGNETFKEILSKHILFEKPSYTEQVLPLAADHSDIVFIQFSSGSTGDPKGVINKQENILYNLQNSKYHLHITSSDTFLGWMPLTHDMGLVFFHLLPLVTNAPQYLMPSILFLTYPELWVESLGRYQISISGSPNFGYKYGLDSMEKANLNGVSYDSLRLMLNSGEAVSVQVSKAFTEYLAPYGFSADVIKPAYGLAEAVLGVSVCYGYTPQLKEHFVDRSKLQIGSEVNYLNAGDLNTISYADLGPYYGTEMKITDEANNTLENNFLGYINIRSKAVTPGYYNDPEVTKKVLNEDGWLNTGDLGFICDGHLVITGRAKEMILVKGQNYFPNDLERVAEQLPEVSFQQAICCSVFNEKSHQDDLYVFMTHKGTTEAFFDLAQKLKDHFKLTVGLTIRKVVKVPKIPKTTSGKIRRYMLRENYFKGEYDQLLTEVDKMIQKKKSQIKQLTKVEIEQKIIKTIATISTHHGLNNRINFFDLGLTSLQVMQLKGHLESYIDEDLDEVAFFKHTTAEALSEYIYSELLHQTKTTVAIEGITDLSAAKSRMKRLLRK